MSQEPSWQEHYEDLGDGEKLQFAGTCRTCGARYVTPALPAGRGVVAEAENQPPRQLGPVEEARAAFVRFDTAFREISKPCPRCGRVGCPDCWDEDHHLCGACVAAAELARSPYRGLPASGPLADGRLHLIARGVYSDPTRPAWLNALLEARQTPVHAGPGDETRAGAMAQSAQAPAQPRPRRWSLRLRQHVAAPQLANGGAQSEQAPIADQDSITCPKCGTLNYDFVTRCRNCDYQIVRLCPSCEVLNPGDVENCTFCGAAMNVREAAVVLERPATYYSVQEIRRKRYRTIEEQRAQSSQPRRPPSSPLARLRRDTLGRFSRARNHVVTEEEVEAEAYPLASHPTQAYRAAARRKHLAFCVDALRRGGRVGVMLLWLIGVPVVFGMIAASELSVNVNDLMRLLLHIDIRAYIHVLVSSAQSLWTFVHS